MPLHDLRTSYRSGTLERADLADRGDDPIALARAWIDDAARAGVREPNALALATVADDGRPSLRMVLLKGLDERGFAFYTHLDSRKGRELRATGRAAGTMWWDRLERQLRVEGRAEPVPDEEADAYFASRPYGSRIGAHASPQSREIADRSVLEVRTAELRARWPEDGPEPVPRPERWGGFRIVPERIEFWQGREDRLHDRFAFEREGGGWRVARLAP